MKTIFWNFITTLKRYKAASVLNIFGLSVAFAAFVIILMQVNYELSFDRFHRNADRIYRVEVETPMGTVPLVSYPFGPTFGSSMADVEAYCILMPPMGDMYVTVERNGSEAGFMEQALYASEGFLSVFTPELLEGTDKVLSEPDRVLLPASLARKFFGTEVGVVGKRISLTRSRETEDYQVGAVYRDFPENSQIRNVVYVSKSQREWQQENWSQFHNYMYVLLRPGADIPSILAEWNRFDLKTKVGWTDGNTKLGLTPLTDIYFDTRPLEADMLTVHGRRTTTHLLLAVALLVIGIAAVNFVNFATSLTPLRIKAINTQKVFGAPVALLRASLVVEAVGIALLAYAAALLWIFLLGDTSFGELIDGGIAFTDHGTLLLGGLLVALAVGLLAGLYPAYYTTKFPPALVLKKGSFGMSPTGKRLRTLLIGFQFVVSIGLIVGALFLQLQNNYLRHVDTGIDRTRIAYTVLRGDLVGSDAFEAEVKRSPLIEDVAYSQLPIGVGNVHPMWSRPIQGREVNFSVDGVSWNFPRMMGLELTEGSLFSPNDSMKQGNTYLFNERAQRKYDIGVQNNIVEWGEGDDAVVSQVCGIVRDFNFQSLHSSIEPYAMVVFGRAFGGGNRSLPVAYFQITGDPYAALEHIRRAAASVDPAYPVDVRFLDEAFDDLYRKELRITSLITLFSLLAVCISLVGVFGLILFETQYRRKEIGVRKVMGATVGEILLLFNRSFVRLVLLCFVIAAPLAWYAVTRWLETFAYRTPVYWWVFAVALFIVLLITFVTVTTQSWRAATANPVESLKTE